MRVYFSYQIILSSHEGFVKGFAVKKSHKTAEICEFMMSKMTIIYKSPHNSASQRQKINVRYKTASGRMDRLLQNMRQLLTGNKTGREVTAMLIIVIRTLLLYTAVIFSLRIMGKRQIGELQPSELVVAIMISDLATVPMASVDIPLLSGVVPVLTLIIAEVITSYLSLKSRRIRKFITGEPSIVVYDGIINESELERLRFNINDLLEELRFAGFYDVADVEVAVIETSGKLSVIPRDQARTVTVEDMRLSGVRHDGLPCTVITDGQLNRNELERSGKNEKWLAAELKKHGAESAADVFIASISAEGSVFVQLRENKGKGKRGRKR